MSAGLQCLWLLAALLASLSHAQLAAPEVKVLFGCGGYGNGGTWLDTGNRLPDNWMPPALGTCSATTSPNRMVQAVGYSPSGTTCSFQKYQSFMPIIHKTDQMFIAASTDLYMQFHFPDDYRNNPRAPQWGPCTYAATGGAFNESVPNKMCGGGCGVCYSITGPAGTATYIVNEVADIAAIGISGQGVNFNLYSGTATPPNRKVMNYNGPTHVSARMVPCPVTGDIVLGVHGFGTTPLNGQNCQLTPINHRLGITQMWIREQGTATWRWVPRGWTNTFDFFPSNGLTGAVFGASATQQFEVRLRAISFPGTADIVCSGTWAPTVVSAGFGVQTVGTCQFPDPGVSTAPCPMSTPPHLIEDQFYSYSGTTDTSPPKKTSGPYLLEWRDWGSFNCNPGFGSTADCQSGSCIDSGLATGFAAIQLGWTQLILPAAFSGVTAELRYWAKCASATACVITVNFGPCGTTAFNAAPQAITNAWAQYTVSVNTVFASCATGFQVVQFKFNPNMRILVDTALWFCNGSPCTAVVPPTQPNPPCGGATTASSTTTTVAGGPTSTPCGYAVCCTLGSLPLPPTHVQCNMTLSSAFSSFDCSTFAAPVARAAGCLVSDIIILGVFSGSTIITLGMPSPSSTQFSAATTNGTTGVPNLQQFVSPSGTAVSPSAAFAWWIIIIVLLIVAAAVVVTILLCRHRNKSKGDRGVSYVTMDGSAPVGGAVKSAPAAAPASSGSVVKARVKHDVMDLGEHVLPARTGQIATMSREDWGATSDWVYVQIGDQEGYVPRDYLALVK